MTKDELNKDMLSPSALRVTLVAHKLLILAQHKPGFEDFKRQVFASIAASGMQDFALATPVQVWQHKAIMASR